MSQIHLRLFHWHCTSVTPRSMSPPSASIFMSPEWFCFKPTSRKLAFLSPVLGQDPVTLNIEPGPVTIPETLKYSVSASFHTSCLFSLCPGIGQGRLLPVTTTGPCLIISSACMGLCPQPGASSSSAGRRSEDCSEASLSKPDASHPHHSRAQYLPSYTHLQIPIAHFS